MICCLNVTGWCACIATSNSIDSFKPENLYLLLEISIKLEKLRPLLEFNFSAIILAVPTRRASNPWKSACRIELERGASSMLIHISRISKCV